MTPFDSVMVAILCPPIAPNLEVQMRASASSTLMSVLVELNPQFLGGLDGARVRIGACFRRAMESANELQVPHTLAETAGMAHLRHFIVVDGPIGVIRLFVAYDRFFTATPEERAIHRVWTNAVNSKSIVAVQQSMAHISKN